MVNDDSDLELARDIVMSWSGGLPDDRPFSHPDGLELERRIHAALAGVRHEERERCAQIAAGLDAQAIEEGYGVLRGYVSDWLDAMNGGSDAE